MLIIDFVHSRSNLGDFAKPLSDAVETAFAKQDLRGLREVSRDLREMADGLAPGDAKELETLLRDRLGIEVTTATNAGRAAVHAIADRGRIRNDREYREVLQFLDRNDASPDAGLHSALQALLQGYRTAQ